MIHEATTDCISEVSDGSLVCQNTGRTFRVDRQPIFCCDPGVEPYNIVSHAGKQERIDFKEDLLALGIVEEDEVNLFLLWRKWEKAIRKWRKAGKPVRNRVEVGAILIICKNCEHYSKRLGVLGYCKLCGCNVSNTPIGELNKIRMATEKCPKGKWE